MIYRLLFVFLLVAPVAHAQDADAGLQGSAREPYRDPAWAAARGALVPGSVHMQSGEPERGTAYLVAALVLAPFALGFVEFPLLDDPDFSQGIGVLGYAMVAGVSAYESAEIAERLNVENGYDLDLSIRTDAMRPARGVRITLIRAAF